MAFGYTPQGSSGMSYCNQTPFPPHEGWGLGTRLENVRKRYQAPFPIFRAGPGDEANMSSRSYMYSHAREKIDLAFCTSYEDETSADGEQHQVYKTYPS